MNADEAIQHAEETPERQSDESKDNHQVREHQEQPRPGGDPSQQAARIAKRVLAIPIEHTSMLNKASWW